MAEKEPKAKEKRQFVRFAAYRVDPAWRRLPQQERDASRKEFLAALEEVRATLILRTYSCLGTRGDFDFLLWLISDRLEAFQDFQARLLKTGLGKYLTLPHSYLGMTKRSIYVDKHVHEGQEGVRLTVKPGEAKYLFVYPFVKTRDWYRLTRSARQGMMDEHIAVGHRYPSVKLNTTYSFGLDDQEFIVAFESDVPADFLDLVMELRETEASRYTLRDTPILAGIAVPAETMLDLLG
ncbi:MAG: chlorite dismutase family protein [candidate division NC10 bacterium]|nr:chlorite dismutase family protein [candidate division NC10 bacterium]MBI3002030.1 chlorite dismutase family protein [candidate division NC10 bacterium]